MRYIHLIENDNKGIGKMSELAREILKEHYYPINGKEQTDYMLDKFQSIEAIGKQLNEGYQYFFVCNDDDVEVGFLAYYFRSNELYLSKFYIQKDFRGKGISRDMLKFLIDSIQGKPIDKITLNVNKYNPSVKIYEKLGFVKSKEEIIDIGNGFVMDDYVYEYLV